MKETMKNSKFNKTFAADLLSQDNGIQKQAAADFNDWLVTYQRQDGVFRKYMPPQAVTEADFAEEIDNRDPVIYRSIKPRSAGAISTNFDTGTISTGMWANKYKTYLHRAWTPTYRIDKIYLTAYKGDLLGVFKDLSLQDLLGLEDLEGMSLVDACVGDYFKTEQGDFVGEFAATKGINPELGIRQYIKVGTDVTPDSIALAVEGLTLSTDNLSPAKALVHRSFWYRLINALKANNYGDRIAENTLMGDLSGLEESMMGIRWITVLENKLVPRGTVYISADSQYCGDFFTYGEAEIFTEVKSNIWFEMTAHETYGMAMPYRGCVVRADFAGTMDSWTAE